MRAIRFPAQGRIALENRPALTPGPGEVLVAVRASGLCHTDLEVLSGNYGTSAFPLTPGHEFAGVVAGLGAGVSGLAEGDRVVIDPNLECGDCPACRRGLAHLCARLGAYGVTVDGGFAETCVVAAGACHPAGDLPFHVAALAEPIGCILNGIEAAGSRAAGTALIFGAGAMGMLMALSLRALGGTTVTLADIDEGKLDRAAAFGFEALHAASDTLSARRHAFDVAVDATGVPSVVARLPGFTSDGGTVHVFGVCPQEAEIPIRPFELFRRQLRIAGSHSLNHNIPAALDCLARIGDDAGRIVTHRLTLEEMAHVMDAGLPPGALKVQAALAD